MARVIGLDIVANQVYAVQLKGGGRATNVSASMAVELPLDLNPANVKELGDWLANQLRDHGFVAGEVVCTLDRSRVTPKTLKLPTCPEHELPAMVAFEMGEEREAFAGETVVDFQAAAPSEDGIAVLAAVTSKALVDTVAGMLDEAGLTCTHVGFRPYSAHFVWRQMTASPEARSVLLIVPGTNKLDLSLWAGEQLCLSRSLSIPADEVSPERTITEIRRTLASYFLDSPNGDVESLVLCSDNHQALLQALQSRTEESVEQLDFSDRVHYSGSESVWSLLPAIGSVWRSSANASFPLDFRNPKKPVALPDRRKRISVLATLLTLFIAVTGYLFVEKIKKTKQQQIDSLQAQLAELELKTQGLQPTVVRRQSLKRWVDSEVHWLNEIRDLAVSFPATDQAYLTRLDAVTGKGETPATMKLDGRAANRETATDTQTKWQTDVDGHYGVVPGPLFSEAGGSSNFEWTFQVDLEILPLDRKRYVGRAERQAGATLASLPEDMKRAPVPLAAARRGRRVPSKRAAPTDVASGTQDQPSEAAKSSPRPPGGDRPPPPPARAETDATDPVARLLESLKSLPKDQQEARIKKAPRFLQARIRKMLAESGQ